MTSIVGVADLGSDKTATGIDLTAFATVATAFVTGWTTIRTDTNGLASGAITFGFDATTSADGATTAECEPTTSGFDVSSLETTGVDPDPSVSALVAAATPAPAYVAADSSVLVVALMIIGPGELADFSWFELLGESDVPVSAVLSTDPVAELTSWLEPSTLWLSAVEPSGSGSAEAIAPPALPTRMPADSMQTPSAKRQCVIIMSPCRQPIPSRGVFEPIFSLRAHSNAASAINPDPSAINSDLCPKQQPIDAGAPRQGSNLGPADYMNPLASFLLSQLLAAMVVKMLDRAG